MPGIVLVRRYSNPKEMPFLGAMEFAVVTLTDGRVLPVGDVNRAGGSCDCCSMFDVESQQVAHVDVFRIDDYVVQKPAHPSIPIFDPKKP